jgi:hypothetical protein
MTVSAVNKKLWSSLCRLLKAQTSALIANKLCKAKPDHYYGSHPDKLDKKVRERLSDKIVPSRRKHLPVLPSFFVDIKGPGESGIVAKRQACYDGALEARGMHALRTYRARIHQAPGAYNNAHADSLT